MLYTLLGKKIGMTQIYDEHELLIPVTVIEAGPCPVVQVKTKATDGYNAIQIGFSNAKDKHTTSPQKGHFEKHGVKPLKKIQEIRCDSEPTQKSGDILTVSQFTVGQSVDVVGTVKGRGFQGVMKKFNFQGGPASHGSMFHRRGGSYGMRQTPGHIFKNKKMPGHLGNVSRTVQNLTVVKVLSDKNIILVKGSIPGANGTDIVLRNSIKSAIKAAQKA
ncbi:MAG: 50S ribosomal protein L3 [Verrucomicrobiota bacterium]|nr:50S ribosomal protein L3 [Verrucomicrobiota bacterium]